MGDKEKNQKDTSPASETTRRQLKKELDRAGKMGIDTGILSSPGVFDDIATIIERAIRRQRQEPPSTENTKGKPTSINTKRRGRKPKPKKP